MNELFAWLMQGAAWACLAWAVAAGFVAGLRAPADQERAFGQMRRWIWIALALAGIRRLGEAGPALDPARAAAVLAPAHAIPAEADPDFALFCRRLAERDQALQASDPDLARRLLEIAYTADGRASGGPWLAGGGDAGAGDRRQVPLRRTLLAARRVERPGAVVYEVEMIVRWAPASAPPAPAPPAERAAAPGRGSRRAPASGPQATAPAQAAPRPVYQQVNFVLRRDPYLKIDQEALVTERPATPADLERERQVLSRPGGPLCASTP